jgi:alpha-L-fucosidase
MTVEYSKASPYYNTNNFGNKFLDILVNRDIEKQSDDVSYTIDKIYEYRPDLLAYDLYGDSALWWVFRARNPNVLDDPIFDFSAGTTIMIPKKTTLVDNLGL